MNRTNCLSIALVYLCILIPPVYGQTVIDFDELNPPDQGNGNFYFDGYGADATESSWQSGGAIFNTSMFGPGWSYSRVNDITTAGFTNQWAAVTGSDSSGDGIYVLANSFVDDGAIINIPAKNSAESVLVTNSTFAFLSMLNGDQFAKMFGGKSGDDPDFFSVTFRGFEQIDGNGNVTGEVEFFLADFRPVNNRLDYIVNQWNLVDLSSLAEAQSIGLSFASSDSGDFGINTRTYVAIDDFRMVDRIVLGDVNNDGDINLLDVQPFVKLITSGTFLSAGDINLDGVVDLLDVEPFVSLLQN